MSGLTDLQAAVAANTVAITTAIGALAASGDSDAAVEALAVTLAADTARLLAAVPVAPAAPAA